MEELSGAELVEQLSQRIGGAQVTDIYLDEDEDGRYLGVVFTDAEGETEYHLTFDEDGIVELAQGPVEGEALESVMSFALEDVNLPFSEDGASTD